MGYNSNEDQYTVKLDNPPKSPKMYTEAEVQQAVKKEREGILSILIEEQEEFAEDRDKNCLNYAIATLRAKGNE